MIVDNENREAPVLSAPIPGQSFTDDPTQPNKWETPPEITDVEEGVLTIVHPIITDDEALGEFLRLAEGGIALEHMVTMATYTGFKEGKWTPDLMLLMQEPLIYYMIAICESAQIEYNLDEDDMNRTMQDPSYRYSSDPEFEDEVEALGEKAMSDEVIDEELLSQVAKGPSLLSPNGGEEMMNDEELL
jgi:hypothetical protein